MFYLTKLKGHCHQILGLLLPKGKDLQQLKETSQKKLFGFVENYFGSLLQKL